MFDWSDRELTNIIWAEAGESGDHIVPYQEGSEDNHKKKEWSQEATTIKPTEQRTPEAKGDYHGRKLEGNPSFKRDEGISASGFSLGSWPELSSSNAAKTDQDSLGSEVSNSLGEITKYNLSVETAELDKDPEKFQNSQEGKEQGDFVDYSWANIGSFDDLDPIFSNDDPIFGHVSLDSADELWSSSKDVTNSPVESFPITAESPSFELGGLRDTSQHLDFKTEYEQPDGPPFIPNYVKLNRPTSHGLHSAQAIPDQVAYSGGKSKPNVKEKTDVTAGGKATALSSCLAAEKVATPYQLADKAGSRKKLSRYRKKPEQKVETKLVEDFYGAWTPTGQYENQLSPSMVQSSSSSVLSQQRQLQGSEALRYQHIPSPFMGHPAYGNLANTYPMMPMMSHIQSGEFNRPPMLSGYEVSPNTNPMNKSADTPAKTLTPQEKIEKLRRRQQMQAMLAIQKQQQQFGHQASCSDHSISQKHSQENQIQHVEGSALTGEDLSALPSLDPNSPSEQDDSNTISVAIDDLSAEETILYRLQDIIAKLDVRIRLCIRDSLIRLAQSAMQRHYACDGSSTNKSGGGEQEAAGQKDSDSRNRYARMPDAETRTNPIDRIVAHLLFRRPLDLPGKYLETPESPASIKIPMEHKKGSLATMQAGCMPEGCEIKQNFSHQGSKNPCPSGDTSENTSNYGPGDGGAVEVESPQ